MSAPPTQLAAILTAPGQIDIREVPRPEPGPGELVVHVRAATTCGTDLKLYRRGHPLFDFPLPFGHEFSGVVAAVGKGVAGFAEGDAVMAVHSAPCGDCRYCRRDLPNFCTTLLETMALGAYSEYIRLPLRHVRQNVFHKPVGLAFAEASLLEPLSCVVYGLRQLDLRPAGDEPPLVLVYGAGPIALMFVRLLVTVHDARVVVVARRADRRALADQMGAHASCAPADADACLRGLTGGWLAAVAVDCTGVPGVWEHCVDLVDKGGQVLFYGGCQSDTTITLSTRRVHYDQLRLFGVFHFDPAAVHESATLLGERRVDLRPLLTAEYELAGLADVFAQLDRGAGGIKDVIRPPGAAREPDAVTGTVPTP